MPLFECDNCGTVENTALGQYWARNLNIFPEPYNHKQLCSECGSPFLTDGEPTGYGKWHGKFPKETVEEHDAKYPNSKVEYRSTIYGKS